MRIEQLFYLTEVAKTRSINLAAGRLYVSQPTISEAIQKLEQELGVTLLHRSPQGVYLTENGEKVVQRAREVLKIIDDLKSEVISHSEEVPMLKGPIHISSVPLINECILPKALSAFNKHHPGIDIIIREESPYEVISSTKVGKADIGLIVIPNEPLSNCPLGQVPSDNELRFEQFFSDKLVVGAGKTSSWAHKRFLTIKQLLTIPVAIYENTEDNWHVQLLKKYGEPKRIFVCNSTKLLRKMVISGMAVAFYSETFLNAIDPVEQIVAIPIRRGISLSFGWIRSNSLRFPDTAQEFVRVFKSCYAQRGNPKEEPLDA